jgi:hypothetical protein
MSLEVIPRDELIAMAKSLGAADAALEQIAKGDWRKSEMVALAKKTMAMMKRFEEEGKKP